MKLIYAYGTYAVLGLVYSLVNIPYGSLASAVTQSVHERAKLVAARAFGASGRRGDPHLRRRRHDQQPEGAEEEHRHARRTWSPTSPRCRARSPRSPWRSS